MKTETKERDFEYWAALAKSDPERFEAERKEAVEQELQKLPAGRQERLRRLQWKIDEIRKLFPNNPLGACIRIHTMMLDRAYGNNGLTDSIAVLHCSADVFNRSAIDVNNALSLLKSQVDSLDKLLDSLEINLKLCA